MVEQRGIGPFSREDLERIEKDPRPDWLEDKFGTLADRDILRCLLDGVIVLTPLPENLPDGLNSCKLDFHLGDNIISFRGESLRTVNLRDEVPAELQQSTQVSKENPYILRPGNTVLAATLEWLELPDFIIARVEGKSRVARVGLGIQHAAVIDAGWQGRPTLELYNSGVVPIELRPNDPIGAFSFELLTSPALLPYGDQKGTRYKRQGGPRT